MTHVQTQRAVTFYCDNIPCENKFGSPVLSIRGAWAEAAKADWVLNLECEGSVSAMKHYCPSCAKLKGVS